MTWKPLAIAASALALCGCATPSNEQLVNDASVSEAPSATGPGASAILPILDEKAGPKGNVFFSPLSIDYAFSIVALGARGETATQLASILPEPAPPEAYSHDGGGVELRLASRLWVERQFKPANQYVADAKARFDAGIERIDKLKPVEGAAKINSWADKATSGLIPNVVSAKEIRAMTAMIITNAIYFDGNWSMKFSGYKMEPFLRGDGRDEPFKLMTKRQELATINRGDWRAIRLPYSHPRYAMDVIMPERRKVMDSAPSLGKIEDFGARLDKAEAKLVDLELPQFEIDTNFELVKPLQQLGLTLPFDTTRVDLSGMVEDGGRGLVVGGAKQLAKLQVFDTGTKAAAVTVISIAITSAAPPDRRKAIDFTVDRPFVVVLRDLENGTILFLGRVANPKEFEPEVEDF